MANKIGHIDTDYTQYAVCPWCGHEELDSWELEDDEYDCGACDKPYVVVRNVSVDYCTFKPTNEDEKI